MNEQTKSGSVGCVLIAVMAFAVAEPALAGVCRIGTTEYDSLQAAFDAAPNKNATIELLEDLDLSESVVIPRIGVSYTCTLDGCGHTINRKFRGQAFVGSDSFIHIHFRNVVVNGGGETYSTASDSTNGYGTFFLTKNDASSVTLESGCVISNFVSWGALIGQNYGYWKVYVKDGARVVCNTVSGNSVPKTALLFDIKGGLIQIDGGEIAYNTATGPYVASGNQNAETMSVNGGDIHHNTGNCAFYPFNYNGKTIAVSGGQIHDNASGLVNFGSGWGRIIMTGGMIYGNASSGIRINYGDNAPGTLRISGDAVVAGNGGSEVNQNAGVATEYAYRDVNRVVLDGDFTGYALIGDTSTSQGGRFDIGSAGVVTNAGNYAGAENFHYSGKIDRILKDDPDAPGLMRWREPKKAKIGGTEYSTLAAALAAAADGAVIELAEDALVTETLVPPAGKSVTVDGKGRRIFRCGAFPLFTLSEEGSSLLVRNVTVQGGRRTSYGAHADGDIAGEIADATAGVSARIAFGENVAFRDVDGSHSLIAVAAGSTVAFDGAVATNIANAAVVAETGSTVEVRGATEIHGNDGDIAAADANVLKLTGNLTGRVHVTVAGAEAFNGQVLGHATGDWTGLENFINGGDDAKLQLGLNGGILSWSKPGLLLLFR